MKRFIRFKTQRFILGMSMSVIIFTIAFSHSHSVKATFVLALLSIISGTFNMDNNDFDEKTIWMIYSAWILVSAFLTCFLSELVLNERLLSLGVQEIVLNCIICLFLFGIFFLAILKPILSYVVISSGIIIISTINYYVYHFRGSEIQPSDFLSIVTANDIANKYNLYLTTTILYSWILWFIFIFFSFGLPKLSIGNNRKCRGVFLLLEIFYLLLFCVMSKDLSFYNYLNIGSKKNGYLLNFTLQLRETFVKKPNPYSINTISSIGEIYPDRGSNDKGNPDIIVIMNESFADLSYLGSPISSNIEVTPFIDSLKANTVRGYALSSVFGGNTANSEFEFLTGHSMLFLPSGSVAYQQYIDSGDYSIVGKLNGLGYTTIAMHPNKGKSWARDVVYEKLCFDETYFLEYFPNQDYRRDFISDQELYETLVENYENHKIRSDNPLFYYAITIQNHGSYEYDGDNYEHSIYLDGYSKEYSDVEQYLSMIHESDKSFEYLIEYFSKCENNIVILFYGDHLPNLNEQFYEEVHGGSFETLDERQLKYAIPFYIWTNYDSIEKTVDMTSLNYLSNYLFEAAGIPLFGYNCLLSDFEKKIPAINANGYYSLNNSHFLTLDEAENDEREILNLYNQLEYNAMFDRENRNTSIFPYYSK